jgi:hypothetical protein
MVLPTNVPHRTSGTREPGETEYLWALAVAADVAARLREPSALDEAASRLSRFVVDLGCAAVLGVSPVGEQLARTVASTTKLPLWTGGPSPAGRIAVLEAVVNSGVNLVAAMRRARASGAHDVVGVALVAQTVAITAWRAQGETLAAVEEI